MINILPETREVYTIIHEINVLAFGRENEAWLVDNLRKSRSFHRQLSLVAIKKGRVVGHILFSPIVIKTERRAVPALALAPMAVHPEFQNQGIGSELVRQGLEGCRASGHKIVVVVGHPTYYPRFGFVPARPKGLEAPFPVPDEAFMVVKLVPGSLEGVCGMVNYPAEFDDV
jgi:putative acetyltransferase